MASLDVSDAFDPSFYTTVLLKQQRTALDSEGVYYEIGFSVIGIKAVVIPGAKAPTGAETNNYITGSITVYTKFPLSAPTPTEPPAYIIYQNQEYRISTVSDFGIYGAGFYTAICYLEDARNE